jgi:hypothetical protein
LSAFGIDWLVTHLADKGHKLWSDILQLLGLGVLVGLLMRFIYPLITLVFPKTGMKKQSNRASFGQIRS